MFFVRYGNNTTTVITSVTVNFSSVGKLRVAYCVTRAFCPMARHWWGGPHAIRNGITLYAIFERNWNQLYYRTRLVPSICIFTLCAYAQQGYAFGGVWRARLGLCAYVRTYIYVCQQKNRLFSTLILENLLLSVIFFFFLQWKAK